MTQDAKCGAVYVGLWAFTCILPDKHIGDHDDGEKHKWLNPDGANKPDATEATFEPMPETLEAAIEEIDTLRRKLGEVRALMESYYAPQAFDGESESEANWRHSKYDAADDLERILKGEPT